MKSPHMIRALGFAALLVGVASPLHAARQDGLVVYMNFDDEREVEGVDNTGPLRNLAADSEVRGKRIGLAMEPTLVAGRFGKAAEFKNSAGGNAIDDWAINLGKLDEVYAGNFTVACWVRYTDSHKGVIVGNKELGNAYAAGWLFRAEYGKHFHAAPVGQSSFDLSAPKPTDGAWHHWAAVVNREGEGSVSFYFDGKLVKSTKLATATASLGAGRDTLVGAGADEKNGAAKKLAVDDLGIWRRALSEAEITALGSGTGKRIPESSSLVWAGAGAAVAGLAWVRRRRARKA